MIERQSALVRGEWRELRIAGWVVKGFDRFFQEPDEADAAARLATSTAVPVFVINAVGPVRRHHFIKHQKWPQFCNYCGYAAQERLQHFQAEECGHD